ncbi:MAG: type III-B CRISPR module RAMP protein Cmr6 [Candidatus Eisenbacteria bacterium]|nr:type III-B CRISPR module RAMP protein Cmr6 [Candidatus Eisenbacteria bacterium]
MIPVPAAMTGDRDFETSVNLSLRYYKLADVFEEKKNNAKQLIGYEITKDRSKFLKNVIKRSTEKKDVYAEAFRLRRQQLDQIGDGFPLTTAKRLLFGVGYSHPLEIGFTFDWTTGLPIIPGSSLKGVARSFGKDKESRDQLGIDAETLKQILGPDPKEPPHESGRIIFFPAYPCLRPDQAFLELDVMTPHYKEYYDDPSNPPADWYNPVPLHFLTVPVGVKYCFRLADRHNLAEKETPDNLLGKAMSILKSALTEHGVGAKTAVDYGYFKE